MLRDRAPSRGATPESSSSSLAGARAPRGAGAQPAEATEGALGGPRSGFGAPHTARGQPTLNLNEAAKVSAKVTKSPHFKPFSQFERICFPDPQGDAESDEHDPSGRSLEEGRRWNYLWANALEAAGVPVGRARKIRGCCVRGDWMEHTPRAAKLLKSGALCPAAPESGGRVVTLRPYKCNDKRLCAVDAVQEAREAADRAMRLFVAVSKAILGVAGTRAKELRELGVRGEDARSPTVRGFDVEFTVPKEVRDQIDWGDHKRFLDVAHRTWQRLVVEEYPDVERVMCMATVHPTSSSRPWIWAPHVHMLGLNWAVTRRGELRELRFHLKPHQMVRLKEVYREEMQRAFGFRLPSKPVVHYGHFPVVQHGGAAPGAATPQAEHKFQYTLRAHLEDVRKGLAVVDLARDEVLFSWYEKQSGSRRNRVLPLPEFFEGVLKGLDRPRGYHRARWYGALSNRLKGPTLRALGLSDTEARAVLEGEDAPDVQDADLGMTACPLCGGGVYVRERGVVIDQVEGRAFIAGVTTARQVTGGTHAVAHAGGAPA